MIVVNRNVVLWVILVAAAVGIVVALMFNRGTPLPGRNQAAEIIHPETRQRIAVKWDEVFGKMKPRLSPGNGAWMVNYPAGSESWAFVVNAGAPDPGGPKEGVEATTTREQDASK